MRGLRMRKGIYSRELLEQIRSSTDLPGLIKRYTRLYGKEKAECPFHVETRPSLSINNEKKLWYCHGCGAGGDPFSFVMKKEKVSFPTAVKVLAIDAGIKLPEEGI